MPYTQAMTFSDICTEITTIRFSSAQSTSIQRWVNDAYNELWTADEWTFRYGRSTTVTATAGSATLTNLPADFGIPIGLWRNDDTPLTYRTPRAFFNLYAGATDTGAPLFYTILDQSIIVGPIPDSTSAAYVVAYEKRFTAMTADSDGPAIPEGNHYLLVTGGMRTGCRLYNDFTYEFQDQAWTTGIAGMRREWLVDQRGEAGVWGRDDVETMPGAWGI